MKAGIYPDLPMSEYLKLPALSSGVAHDCVSLSPHEAWFGSVFNPDRIDTPNDVSDTGTCAHAMLLEGSEAKICVIQPEDYPSKPTKAEPEGRAPKGWANDAIRAARDAARANGLIPLLPWDMPPVRDMVSEANRYLATTKIPDLLSNGKPEQTIIWYEGDVMCKARPDWLSDSTLMHFKTTKMSVRPQSFERTVGNLGYDFAMMFYLRGLDNVLPGNEIDHYILAQRQEAPYVCKLFDLTSARADVLSRQVERAISIWAACQAAGKFPSYSGEVHSIDLTAWQMEQALENGDIDGLGYDADIVSNGVQA